MKKEDKDRIKSGYLGDVITSPIKAIRAYCVGCCMYSANEVKLCTSRECVLWPYRFGVNVYTHRELTEEQRELASERLKKARASREDPNN